MIKNRPKIMMHGFLPKSLLYSKEIIEKLGTIWALEIIIRSNIFDVLFNLIYFFAFYMFFRLLPLLRDKFFNSSTLTIIMG